MFSGPLTLEGAASTTSQNVVQETASDCTQYPTRMKISISYIYIYIYIYIDIDIYTHTHILIGSLVEIRR